MHKYMLLYIYICIYVQVMNSFFCLYDFRQEYQHNSLTLLQYCYYRAVVILIYEDFRYKTNKKFATFISHYSGSDLLYNCIQCALYILYMHTNIIYIYITDVLLNVLIRFGPECYRCHFRQPKLLCNCVLMRFMFNLMRI